MHAFDFFAEFTSTATRPWSFATFVSPHHLSSKETMPRKPVLHDLSFDLTPSYSTTQHSPSCTPSPRSPHSPAVQMPLELILLIIEAASDHGIPDISFLQSCSLVCRAWSLSAQKLLFRTVTLRTQKAFDSFRSAVDRQSDHSLALRHAVRRLHVVMDYSQPAHLHQHAFALAVAMCPNLQELELALYGSNEPARGTVESSEESQLRRDAPSFDVETMSLLRSASQISALSFSNWSENQQCIFQLLEVWPSLRTLSMSGTSPHLLFPAASDFFAGALEELRINFQAAPSIEFMNWLLHHSTGSLRSLTFERDPCPDLFDFMATSYGSTLQSLSIPNCSSAEHARSIEQCDGLQFIRMDQPRVNPLVYKSLPNTISHLALGVDRDTPLQPVIDLVKSRPALEMVTIRLWNGGDNHRLLSALKIACVYRGVDLRIASDAQEYKSLIVSAS